MFEFVVEHGLLADNITVTDIVGVVYQGWFELINPYKDGYAIETKARTFGDVISGQDVLLGLLASGVLKRDMVESTARAPLILVLVNPTLFYSMG